jgi:hypothetical protein
MKNNINETELFKKWLRSYLNFGPLYLFFEKGNGTEKIIECTTNFGLADYSKNIQKQKKNDNSISVYDLKSESWKNIRWSSIKKVRFDL